MESSIVVIAGLATMFNFAILKWKFENNRVADAVLDLIVLGVITWSFAGSMTGMVIGVVGSMLFSLYLLWSPFKLDAFNFDDEPVNKNSVVFK